MTPILLTGPAEEPISLADAKSYLRIEAADEDGLVTALISAARLTVEAGAGQILVNQSWRLVLDAWPSDGCLRAPISPLLAVTAVRVRDQAGAATVLSPSTYVVDVASRPGRVLFPGAPPAPGRPIGGIEVDITAGLSATAAGLPESLRLATRRLVAFWFENRGDVAAPGEPALPADVVALMAPWRRGRL